MFVPRKNKEKEETLSVNDLQNDSFKTLFTKEFENLSNYEGVLEDTAVFNIEHINDTLPSYLISDSMKSMIELSKDFQKLQEKGLNSPNDSPENSIDFSDENSNRPGNH